MGTTKDIREAAETELEFDPRDGNLTLTGGVTYGSQRNAAELAVAGLTGVRNIKDEIEISYDAAPVSAAWMAGGVMQVRDDLDITG
jgi:BON domain